MQLFKRRALSRLLALALAGTCGLALADTYPGKPVRLVVPFPPGGAVDAYARMVQNELASELGQPVVIDNRTGAGGMIGSEAVAHAPPDGYTLVVGNIATFAINAGIYKKMPYDPVKDFAPITKTVTVTYVLVVNPKVPVKTAAELVAFARANQGKLTYGSSGSGSAQHMAAELFKARTGANILHVPYKGTGALMGDLIAGHVDMIFADAGSLMPQVKAGKLRVLGIGDLKRNPDYPEIPTIAEAAALPGFETVAWQGVAGPAGLPADIVKRLNTAINKVQAQPAVRARLLEAGLTPDGGTPEAFGAYIEAEMRKWGKVARDIGVSVD